MHGSKLIVVNIGDFLLLTFVNEYVNKLSTGQILDCFWYRIHSIASAKRSSESHKCESGLISICSAYKSYSCRYD